MIKTLTLFASLSLPHPGTLPQCGTAQTVQGSAAFCCSLGNGQQCCAASLDDKGKPVSCGC